MHVEVGRIQLASWDLLGDLERRNLFETFVAQFLLRLYQWYVAFRSRQPSMVGGFSLFMGSFMVERFG
jgi:hypothetical protein